MKKIFCLLSLIKIIFCVGSAGQQKPVKPAIGHDAQREWQNYYVNGNPVISNDGKYIAYEYRAPLTGSMLVVESVNGSYKREFAKGSNPVFSPDSKHLLFSSEGKKTIFNLSKQTAEHLSEPSVVSPSGKWIIRQGFDRITLRNLVSGSERIFPLISLQPYHYTFNAGETILVANGGTYLVWMDLLKHSYKVIQHGSPVSQISFDPDGTKIAFLTQAGSDFNLCFYQADMDSAVIHLPSALLSLSNEKITENGVGFSKDGKRILFRLARVRPPEPVEKDNGIISTSVNVWHYKDEYLYSEQQEAKAADQPYMAIVGIADKKIIRLETVDTAMLIWDGIGKYIVAHKKYNRNDSWWNKQVLSGYDILSTVDGSKKNFLSKGTHILPSAVSPSDKFVIWYNYAQNCYNSYEIATGITRKITANVNESWGPGADSQFADGIANSYGIAGWLEYDEAVLVYSLYDIWQLDPYGRKAPVNLTGGYGRQHAIMFRVDDRVGESRIFKPKETILLAAFNTINKYNGYAKKQIGQPGAPHILVMEPVLMSYSNLSSAPPPIKKALNADVYLVSKQTAAMAPNFYVTTDFTNFRKVTGIHPEHQFNWMTSELLNWTTLDGQPCQGILYKPENFDPQQQYPLIFNYYQERSDELNKYLRPELSGTNINIPWYVSNGYLVFVPDIHYTPGHTGQSAFNAIVAAAKYLSQFSWVKKMGLQGHSFGGYETNYLITKTDLFACAQEGAGASDMVSGFGGRRGNTMSSLFSYEFGQYNLRTTPWGNPSTYIENSPVFHADKINTPLLMMHGKHDNAVPFSQAVEFFTALRRLQKPVWLLDYGNDHVMSSHEDLMDFSIRQQQFFDHYLKGSPAPLWMTEGIQAKDKGLMIGLEPAPGGKCSNSCPVCNAGLAKNRNIGSSSGN